MRRARAHALAHAARQLVRIFALGAGEADELDVAVGRAAVAAAASRPLRRGPCAGRTRRSRTPCATGTARSPGTSRRARRRGRRSAGRRSSTLPDAACSRPASMLSTVVLPQPEGPTMARNSPAANVEADSPRPRHAVAGRGATNSLRTASQRQTRGACHVIAPWHAAARWSRRSPRSIASATSPTAIMQTTMRLSSML